MLTCAECKKEIVGTVYKTKSRKRYHTECFGKLVDKAETANQKKAKSFKNKEWDSLVKYICSLYGLEEITYVINKQIEDFVNHWGYTYVGIQQALCYFHEMEGNNASEKATIGIVPYCYDDAMKFFELADKANEANEGFVREEKIVTVKVRPQNRKLPYVMNIEDI